MQRLIPGKTKVNIELFRGVTLGDILVGGVALVMLVFVFISNLAWKYGIAVVILALAALLLFRMDEQANYIYLLHILSYLGYEHHFGRIFSDEQLVEKQEKGSSQAAFDELFNDEDAKQSKIELRKRAKESRSDEKSRRKAAQQLRKKEDKLLKSKKTDPGIKEQIRARRAAEEAAVNAGKGPKLSRSERKAAEKERKHQRKEEDRILKSKSAPESEKEEIRARRKASSEEFARKQAASKDAALDRAPMEDIIAFTGISEGFIEYLNKSYYGAVLEIDPVEFRFFSEHRRVNAIENCLGRVLRSLHAGYSANIVKLERPIVYDRYLDREYDKLDDLRFAYENGVLTESELKSRVEVEYDRINELITFCKDRRVITSFYYLVLFESDKRQLDNQIHDAEQLLRAGELSVHRLGDKELALFLKYSNQIDFDEHEVDKIAPEDLHLWAQPDTIDFRVRRVEVNHIVTHNFRVVNYPSVADDAWLAGVMSIPGTKVVLKCRPMDRAKSIRNIDHSLQELRGQYAATSVDSRRLEIESHISTLQELLTTLQNDSESLLECNIYITAYDIVSTRNNLEIVQPPLSELPTVNEMKKNVRRSWQENGFRLNNMEFDQVQAFIGSQINALDPLAREGRSIPSNTVAACFPWVFAHISDEGGVKLGESDGIPVFIDFFRRDSERVNSNMVIVGKSGSGKSYATKSLLANLAAEDAKIFILDPENEYTELAGNLHGQIINVGNAQYGRLNPFHIITALDDDEAGETGPSGSYATHLQFLEEFFKQIMPDCSRDAMEYLNTLVDHMYLSHDITSETDLSVLTAADYPIFDDLYDEVLQEFQSSDNPFTRDLLRTLMNYIAKFSTGGRNANIWNGPSTVTTDENFTVFNFQSMLANRNQTIANAQMLLVLKYIDNEIIKNRDYNTKYKANRKIVVVIDEAHVFIDAKYPIALDFMFQLAKRIRKYNGMQIVITQNIKDFVGSEELARKSTAIINACQYSFIFALAPNDMQDLVKLYEKAGGINEIEQEQIVQAPRGQAFVVMSPTSRSSFSVETAPGISSMFEQHKIESRYFIGDEGAENWEEFIGDSREIHSLNVAEGREELPVAEESEPVSPTRPGVVLRVFDEDEYGEEEPVSAGSVSFHFDDDDEPEEIVSEAPEEKPAQPEVASDGQTMAVFTMIADALGRMAAAAERGSGDTAFAPAAPAQTQSEARESELLREKDEEIRRLRQEYEQLKAAEENLPEDGDEDGGELVAADADGEDAEYNDPLDDLVDDEYSEEVDDEENSELFTLFGLSQDKEEDDEDDEDEDDWDAGASVFDDVAAGDDDDVIGLSLDEEDEDEDSSDDFMNAFCSFAAKLKEMSPFERLRANGQDVAEITLDDLIEEAKARMERRHTH